MWAGVLIAGIVVGAFATMLVRRWIAAGPTTADAGLPGFTLGELKDMHKAGQLTDAEFERAKAKIIHRAQASAAASAATTKDQSKKKPSGDLLQ